MLRRAEVLQRCFLDNIPLRPLPLPLPEDGEEAAAEQLALSEDRWPRAQPVAGPVSGLQDFSPAVSGNADACVANALMFLSS